MTTATVAIPANTGASISFLTSGARASSSQRVSQQPQTVPAAQPAPVSTAPKEDTVQLSATTQSYLQGSQTQATQAKGLVAQLVQAAAAGDTGALSLLTVV